MSKLRIQYISPEKVNDQKILGTLNILHKERFYTKKSVKMIQPYAQLLSPYFILHQLKMKKKKK